MKNSRKVHREVTHDRPMEVLVPLLQDFVAGHPDHTVIVGVCGPGGSGKSTLCQTLTKHLADCTILQLDDYNRPRSERLRNRLLGSHPNAVKLDLIIRHVADLKRGLTIEKPVYDRVSGLDDVTERVECAAIILLDGEAAAFQDLRPYIEFLIYIEAEPETSLSVRLQRDVVERGCDVEKVMWVHQQSNLRDFPRFGAAARIHADVILHFSPGFQHAVKLVAEEHSQHRVFSNR